MGDSPHCSTTICRKLKAQTAVAMSVEKLRSVGLSRNKALAIQDLAQKTLDGTLASRASLVRRSDEAVIENICQVWGIGPWTVQMLGRAEGRTGGLRSVRIAHTG
jgi:3-methyladenine DNA glycosylase/8-oxoguanine DNA glycosylase